MILVFPVVAIVVGGVALTFGLVGRAEVGSWVAILLGGWFIFAGIVAVVLVLRAAKRAS